MGYGNGSSGLGDFTKIRHQDRLATDRCAAELKTPPSPRASSAELQCRNSTAESRYFAGGTGKKRRVWSEKSVYSDTVPFIRRRVSKHKISQLSGRLQPQQNVLIRARNRNSAHTSERISPMLVCRAAHFSQPLLPDGTIPEDEEHHWR